MRKNIIIASLIGALLALTGGVLVVQGQNISSVADEHWAWNHIIDYIDFLPLSPSPNVDVTSQKLSGYAQSDIGEISLDCETTSAGDICGASNYFVSNDGAGRLAGWGWNDAVGWISFCGNATQHSSWNGSSWECPSGETYQVSIQGADFFGYAWNHVIGPISFNCFDHSSCPSPDTQYKTATTWSASAAEGWVESATFDTGITSGAQLNSILWRGDPGTGTEVRFQIAVSDVPEPASWNFNWDTVRTISDPVGENQPEPISYAAFAPSRYFRYRIWLYSNAAQTESPRVDEVIINWSK